MFSELAIVYLFCGGAGGGALTVAALISLLLRRRGATCRIDDTYDRQSNVSRTISCTFLLGTVLLLLGVFCLVADLGRVDRIANLLLSPRLTWMNFGAVVLAIEIFAGLYLSLASFLDVPEVVRGFQCFVEIITGIFGVAVMAYTGLLLEGVKSVALWSSLLLPLLFLLSSTSSGFGVYLISVVVANAGEDALQNRLMSRAARIDCFVIVVEVIVAVAFVVVSASNDRPSAVASMRDLLGLNEQLGLIWWLGYIACGLVAPVLLQLLSSITRDNVTVAPLLTSFADAAPLCVMVAACVLVGSLCLRFGIVLAGQHSDIGMVGPDVDAVAIRESSTLLD